ncbi:extracellular solute-binding protein [Microbacterium sp. GXF0217]
MSNHPRTRLAIGAFTVTGAVLLTGCTAGGGATGGDGDTTVTVMYASNEFTADHIAEFEADNPDITIEFIEYDENRLNAMVAAGDPPDFVRAGPTANLFARGLATPLDDYIAASDVITEDDLLDVNKLWQWDGEHRGQGEQMGLVKDFSPDVTFWQNEAIFEQAGVEPLSTTEPTNWDDLLEKGRQLKAAGVEYPLGIEWQWGVASTFLTMIAQQGHEIYNSDGTEITVNTPEGERALQWLVDFAKEELGPSALNPLAEAQDAPVFLAGRMAATKDGFWFGGNLNTEEGATVAETASLVPAPTFDERISPVLGGIGGYIPDGSDAKDEAWRVMEYFFAGTPAVERASSGWGLPALESLWENIPTEQPFQEQAFELAQEEVQYLGPISESKYLNPKSFEAAFEAELLSVIKAEQSVQEALAAIEAEGNKLIAQGKDQLG